MTQVRAGMEIQEDVLKLRIENEQLQEENDRLKTLIQDEHTVGNEEFWRSVWTWKRENTELIEQVNKLKARIEKIEACALFKTAQRDIHELLYYVEDNAENKVFRDSIKTDWCIED